MARPPVVPRKSRISARISATAGQDQSRQGDPVQSSTGDGRAHEDDGETADQQRDEARLGAGHREDQQAEKQPMPSTDRSVGSEHIEEDDDDGREQRQAEQVRRARPGDTERFGVEDGGSRPAIGSGHGAEEGHGHRRPAQATNGRSAGAPRPPSG